MNFGQKAVAVSRNGLNITGTVGGISQRGPQLGHGFVEASVKIHEGLRGPQPLPDLLPRHQVARMLHEEGEDLKRLVLEFYTDPVLAQLGRFEVHLKRAKALCPKHPARDLHRHPSSYSAKVSTLSPSRATRSGGSATVLACKICG